MSTPYIDSSPLWVYCDPVDHNHVYWIVTNDDGGELARAMFYSLDDAKEYLHKVKGMPLEDIKIATGEEEE